MNGATETEPLYRVFNVLLKDETASATAESVYQSISREPERLLLIATLDDARKMIQENPRKTREQRLLFDEAVEWFASTEDAWTFSFESICTLLGLSAAEIRAEMLKGILFL